MLPLSEEKKLQAIKFFSGKRVTYTYKRINKIFKSSIISSSVQNNKHALSSRKKSLGSVSLHYIQETMYLKLVRHFYWRVDETLSVSLIAQLVKKPPAMQETWVQTWVQSLGWEDPLEKGRPTHSSILPWRIPWMYIPWGPKESDMTEWLSLH